MPRRGATPENAALVAVQEQRVQIYALARELERSLSVLLQDNQRLERSVRRVVGGAGNESAVAAQTATA